MNSATSLDRIAAIRGFNRFYTRQIGVLEEHLYRSSYSLAEVRILYELAHRDRVTASDLVGELGLDAGYLSRILRSFEKRKLLTRSPSPQDGRQYLLALTAKGETAFAPLNAASHEEIGNILARLNMEEQGQLVGAMQSIESILGHESHRSPSCILRQHRPGDMGWVVHRHGILYAHEYQYDERFEALVAQIAAEFIQNFDPKRERCWIAERNDGNVGSVFLVKHSKTVAKLRLLLVEPATRGLGIGKRLVDECVRFADQVGYKKIILWTQSELAAARSIYEKAGFRLAKQERHDSWSRTGLVAETWELKL
jgi:DNA-binding MarR family transcriptional regulator/GNAT superfamily N-acetyltransferase